jgi:SET domain-containing protein
VPFFVSFRIGRARTGLGLFATMPIRKGTYVVEYTGPIMDGAKAAAMEDRGNRYLFEINNRWTIDGAGRANLGRYANHSHKANMEPMIGDKRIFLKAIRNIQPGDELVYDYGKDYLKAYIPVCKCEICMAKSRGKGLSTARKKKKKNANGRGNGKSRR